MATGHIMVASSRLICAGCPVRKECLQFAIDNSINHGMFGGSMPKERRPGSIKFPDGDMPFIRALRDFKKANGLASSKPISPRRVEDLSRAINKTLEEVKEMLKAPDLYILKSDGQITHL